MIKTESRLIPAMVLLVVALGLVSVPVGSLETEKPNSLTCLIVAVDLSTSTDPHVRQVWGMGTLYFLGRVDAVGEHTITAQSIREALLHTTSKALNEAKYECAALLGERGRALSEIGRDLERESAKQSSVPIGR